MSVESMKRTPVLVRILANVKSANIASSDGTGDFVGKGQTRRNTAAKGTPNHIGDPERQMQWQCHGLNCVLLEERTWVGLGSFRGNLLKELGD
ncbi:hypothetical protein E6C27_scaffold135G002590 [Cucumis melo var. makuwa]|uniref:Uncharacterized protein n=1 Tax=Cucumis melo var. makuwa TaxID=1194695 RepID=A0A5A7UHY6_CUCMM|nr:hypothetical protein E6C27_scaffold135G002590 [Cucumis melo var. makuwa]